MTDRTDTGNRRVMGRLALVGFGVLLPFVLVEVALQIAAPIYRAAYESSRRDLLNVGKERILCVGDSYTFGWKMTEPQSYPGQLQAWLDEHAPAREFQVLNVGYPALNTAQMLDELERHLERFSPAVVVILGGQNNRWNANDPTDTGFGRRILTWSRTAKLIALAMTVDELQEVEIEPDDGAVSRGDLARERWKAGQVRGGGEAPAPGSSPTSGARKDLGDEVVRSSTRRHVEQMVETARRHGARVILMTYPSPEPPFQAPSDGMREAAAALEVPLVDHQGRFRDLLQTWNYADLLIPGGDMHPQETGYTFMALDVLRALASMDGYSDLPLQDLEDPTRPDD